MADVAGDRQIAPDEQEAQLSEAHLTEFPAALGPKIHGVSRGLRPLVAIAIAVLASLIYAKPPGSAVAIVYLLPLAATALEQARAGWSRNSAIMFMLALAATGAVLIEPSALNMVTGFCFVAAAALAARGITADDGLGFVRHILTGTVSSPFHLARDAYSSRSNLAVLPRLMSLATIAVPLAAFVIFGSLLMLANPVLENLALQLIQLLPQWLGVPYSRLAAFQILFVFPIALTLAWSVLRRGTTIESRQAETLPAAWHEKFFKSSAIAATLLMLNGMFLIENALDINHVWLQGALPAGMSHAEYVHRGSYTLIVTVILAAIFIMVALRPGTETNDSRAVRFLVYAFAAQNFLLVLSSAKRTLSYIDSYGLTEWRLAGLIWMALVAFGLSLTVWRVLRHRGNRWLINANLSAAAIVVLACGLADFRPFIANFNVERAIAKLDPLDFDVAYNGRDLGFAALPALKRYQDRFQASAPYSPFVQAKIDEVLAIQKELQASFAELQGDWRSWTMRYAGWTVLPTGEVYP